VAGHEKDEPGHFAKLVAVAIRSEMKQRGMSGRALARTINMSEKYARERLNQRFEFTLNDVENFALYIGEDPEEFIGRIERGTLEPEVETRAVRLRLVDVSAGLQDDNYEDENMSAFAEHIEAGSKAAHRGETKSSEPPADV